MTTTESFFRKNEYVNSAGEENQHSRTIKKFYNIYLGPCGHMQFHVMCKYGRHMQAAFQTRVLSYDIIFDYHYMRSLRPLSSNTFHRQLCSLKTSFHNIISRIVNKTHPVDI